MRWSPPVRMSEVDVRLAGGVEVLGEVILVDGVRIRMGRDEGASRVDDLRASGVVEADVERQPGAFPRPLLRGADRALDVGRCLVKAADDPDPDALVDELVGVLAHRTVDEAEEAGDLVVRVGSSSRC